MKNRSNTSAGFFRYFAVIIAAMVMVYGINTISKAIAHTEPASDNSLHISAQDNHSTILKKERNRMTAVPNMTRCQNLTSHLATL